MSARRYSKHRSAGGLTPGVIDVLIGGWSGPSSMVPDDDPFQVFELTEADFGHLWVEHRAALTAEAKRRGIEHVWAARFATNTRTV